MILIIKHFRVDSTNHIDLRNLNQQIHLFCRKYYFFIAILIGFVTKFDNFAKNTPNPVQC